MPDVVVVVVVVRHERDACHEGGVARQCIRPGEGVGVPSAVAPVADPEAEDSASGSGGGELLVLDLALFVHVVEGAHEPCVAFHGHAGISEILEREKCDGLSEFSGHGFHQRFLICLLLQNPWRCLQILNLPDDEEEGQGG